MMSSVLFFPNSKYVVYVQNAVLHLCNSSTMSLWNENKNVNNRSDTLFSVHILSLLDLILLSSNNKYQTIEFWSFHITIFYLSWRSVIFIRNFVFRSEAYKYVKNEEEHLFKLAVLFQTSFWRVFDWCLVNSSQIANKGEWRDISCVNFIVIVQFLFGHCLIQTNIHFCGIKINKNR